MSSCHRRLPPLAAPSPRQRPLFVVDTCRLSIFPPPSPHTLGASHPTLPSLPPTPPSPVNRPTSIFLSRTLQPLQPAPHHHYPSSSSFSPLFRPLAQPLSLWTWHSALGSRLWALGTATHCTLTQAFIALCCDAHLNGMVKVRPRAQSAKSACQRCSGPTPIELSRSRPQHSTTSPRHATARPRSSFLLSPRLPFHGPSIHTIPATTPSFNFTLHLSCHYPTPRAHRTHPAQRRRMP